MTEEEFNIVFNTIVEDVKKQENCVYDCKYFTKYEKDDVTLDILHRKFCRCKIILQKGNRRYAKLWSGRLITLCY